MTDALMTTPAIEDEFLIDPVEDIEIEGDDVTFDLLANIASPNLAFEIDEDELTRLGRTVVDEYEMDLQSRKDEGWDEKNSAAIKLAMQVKEEKTYPWPHAANIKYPLITTAAIQFAARAYPAIVDGWNVVKGKVLGQSTEEKRDRAERIGQHMSWQLLEEMPEWEADTDQLLHLLPITGTMVRKTWFDPVLGRNRSEIIFPDKIVVNYFAKAVCPRITQVMDYYPHEVLERVRSGSWAEITLELHEDTNEPECFLEQHRLWDMDGDGYPEPYIVTVHKETGKVVRVVARYDEDGVKLSGNGEVIQIEPIDYFTKYVFIPSLDGSWYGTGFGTLLNSLNETINATINQLLDAGHLSNMQGGFIGNGVSIKSGNMTFRPGEWKKVQTDAGSLKDSIVPMPVREPSAVLFSLLGMMVEAAKDITATKDILTGETQQSNQPVGTTLAMIEQGLKVFTAIYKRIHRALKQELAQIYRLNRLYLTDEAYFNFQDVEGVVARTDYDTKDIGVIPVSDPTVVTDMQRLGRAQFLMQFIGNPLLDQRAIVERVLSAAAIPDIKTLMPEPQGPPPPDPKAIEAMAKVENENKRIAIEERKADAEIANTLADAEAKTIQTILTNPALFELVREIVRQEEANGPAPVRGMGGEPVNPQGLSGPEGPAIEPGAPMDGGGAPLAGIPGEGPAIGGVGQPQV